MPIYEYVCTSCGHRFETRQSFSDEPVADCPECGAPVRRVLHPAGVIFKGSGWYKTDSRKSDQKAASSDSSTSENGSGDKKSESPSSESKSKKEPAAKPASD